MSRVAAIAWVASAASLSMAAGSTPLSAAFGNTIVSTYPDGRTAEIWLESNGTYTSESRKHDISSGRWRLKGNAICFHQSHPLLPFFTFCTPIPSSGERGGWRSRAPTGEPTISRLINGHVGGRQLKNSS
jgi:hypothetical protein